MTRHSQKEKLVSLCKSSRNIHSGCCEKIGNEIMFVNQRREEMPRSGVFVRVCEQSVSLSHESDCVLCVRLCVRMSVCLCVRMSVCFCVRMNVCVQ